MNKRLIYEAPEAEVLCLQQELNFLVDSQTPQDGYGKTNEAANPFSYRDGGSF